MVTRKRFDWNDEGTWPMRMDYLDVPPEKRPTFESFLAQIGLDEPPRPRNQTFQNGDSELDYELDNVTTYCAACGSIAKFGKLHVRVGFDGRILFIDNICNPCYWKRQNSGRLQPLSPEGEAELSLKDGGVPGHMVKCRFWNYRTQELSGSAEVLDCLKALSGNGITVDGRNVKCVVIAGTTGIGKTHMAVATMYNWLLNHRGKHAAYITESDMMKDLKESVSSKNGDRMAKTRWAGQDFLVIDEVGRSRSTDYTIEAVQDVVQARLEFGFPTIICGNMGIQDMAKRLGEHNMSRLQGAGRAFSLEGEDFRAKYGRI